MTIEKIKELVDPWLEKNGRKSIVANVTCGTYEVLDMKTNEKIIFHENHVEVIPFGYTTLLNPDFESEILEELYDTIYDLGIYD